VSPVGSIRPKDEFPEYSIPPAVDLSCAQHCRLEFHIEDNIIYGATQAVRFNNTSEDKFTWGKNYFNDKNYPAELGVKAGPEQPYRSQWVGAGGIPGRETGQTKAQP